MGFFDDVLQKLGFTTGAEEEEQEESEQEDVGEEDSRGFFQRISDRFRGSDDEEEEEEEAPDDVPRPGGASENWAGGPSVIPFTRKETGYQHRERIYSVVSLDDCKEIIRCLLSGESVLINLENMDPKECGRVVDLLSGAAFAVQGKIVKVAHLSYLLAPQNVEIVERRQTNPTMRYR